MIHKFNTGAHNLGPQQLGLEDSLIMPLPVGSRPVKTQEKKRTKLVLLHHHILGWLGTTFILVYHIQYLTGQCIMGKHLLN